MNIMLNIFLNIDIISCVSISLRDWNTPCQDCNISSVNGGHLSRNSEQCTCKYG